MMTATEAPTPPLLAGYLKKQGEDILKSFKKRYFHQYEKDITKLHYSKTPSDVFYYYFPILNFKLNFLGTIFLDTVSAVKFKDHETIELITPHRTYVLKGTIFWNRELIY